MLRRVLCVASIAVLAAGCQHAPNDLGPVAPLAAPSSLAAAASNAARPWKAHLQWTITGVQWAGVPGADKSLFAGRCSLPSDYVVSASFAGEATHAGRVTGDGTHCTQITWSPEGQPLSVTYGDGRAALVTANGSRMTLRYGHGVTGFDATTGETWFEDEYVLTGQTGPLAGATGSGKEGGRFLDFTAVLGGAPVAMWMEGTLAHDLGR